MTPRKPTMASSTTDIAAPSPISNDVNVVSHTSSGAVRSRGSDGSASSGPSNARNASSER